MNQLGLESVHHGGVEDGVEHLTGPGKVDAETSSVGGKSSLRHVLLRSWTRIIGHRRQSDVVADVDHIRDGLSGGKERFSEIVEIQSPPHERGLKAVKEDEARGGGGGHIVRAPRARGRECEEEKDGYLYERHD